MYIVSQPFMPGGAGIEEARGQSETQVLLFYIFLCDVCDLGDPRFLSSLL